MKKIKLKLKFDELNVVYGDLFNNVVPNKGKGYQHMLMVAVLTKFYMQIATRMTFRIEKKVALTLDMPTACALMMWIYSIDRNPADYLGHVYIKISIEIEKQLA